MTDKPLKDRVKEALDNSKMSFLDLEKATNIPANRMYKWYQQGTNPKALDAETLEKWLNDLEKTPGTGKAPSMTEEPEGAYKAQSVRNLTESNRILAEANRTLAEANKTLAEANHVISKNHDELIQLTKMIVANSTASPRTQPGGFGPENNVVSPGFGSVNPSDSEVKPGKPKDKH